MSCCILMLHRVAELNPHRLPSNEHMKVSPSFLSAYIEHAKKAGFTFLSLDDVVARQRSLGRGKYLCMTLDDGYADNADHALAVFKAHDVPFAVYVTTSFPENTAHFWWYELEHILLEHAVLEVGGREYACDSLAAKDALFLQWRRALLDVPHHAFAATYERMFGPYLEAARQWTNAEQHALTWAQVTALDKEALCTIGGHTHAHSPLRVLPEEGARADMLEGNALLEQHLGHTVPHFAYPFGSAAEAGPREFALAQSLGLRSAVTTRYGFVTPATSVYALPRIMLTEDSGLRDVGPMKCCIWRAKQVVKRILGRA